jgi:hypothetical protein
MSNKIFRKNVYWEDMPSVWWSLIPALGMIYLIWWWVVVDDEPKVIDDDQVFLTMCFMFPTLALGNSVTSIAVLVILELLGIISTF